MRLNQGCFLEWYKPKIPVIKKHIPINASIIKLQGISKFIDDFVKNNVASTGIKKRKEVSHVKLKG